jgi:hypothetical protein
VLPLPISALRSSFPAPGNPTNRHRAVPLTYDQFRYAFANVVSEKEAAQLYETFAAPASGAPVKAVLAIPATGRTHRGGSPGSTRRTVADFA